MLTMGKLTELAGGGSAIARALGWHGRLLADLTRWSLRRQQGVPPGGVALPYAAADRGFSLVLVGLSTAEIVAVELVVPWPAARGVLLVLGGYSLLVLLGLLAAAEVRPHVLTADVLQLRSGGVFDVRLPLEQVESVAVRTKGAGLAVQLGEEELLAPAGGATNLRTATVRRVAFAADDPRGACAQLARALRDATTPPTEGRDAEPE